MLGSGTLADRVVKGAYGFTALAVGSAATWSDVCVSVLAQPTRHTPVL